MVALQLRHHAQQPGRDRGRSVGRPRAGDVPSWVYLTNSRVNPMTQEPVILARLRSDLLDALWLKYPLPLSLDELEQAVHLAYLTRETSWLTGAIRAQLSTLNQSGLIRPCAKGYLLTEQGRRDRQQAARFLGNRQTPPPPEAA